MPGALLPVALSYAAYFDPANTASGATLSNNNLTLNGPGAAWGMAKSNIARSDKRYLEYTINFISSSILAGVSNASEALTWLGNAGGVGYGSDGEIFHNGGVAASGLATLANGDIVQVAIDPATSLVWFGKNGTWQNGDPGAGTGGFDASAGTALGSTVYAAVSCYNTTGQITANFGATAFAYSVPSGFLAWNAAVPVANAYALTADSASFALTGGTTALKAARKATADAGTYTLRYGKKLVADAGVFLLAGNTVTSKLARSLTSAVGSFTFTGDTATLSRTRKLLAETSVFGLNADTATLLTARRIVSAAGNFTLTGQVAGTWRGRLLAAQPFAFHLDGAATALRTTMLMMGDASAFVLTGSTVALSYGRFITAGDAAFALTGAGATQNIGYVFEADAGAFILTNADATLYAWISDAAPSSAWNNKPAPSGSWANDNDTTGIWIDDADATGTWS